MQQDLKHGHGLTFSIFGGESVTNKDKQAILDLNTQLKSTTNEGKAWARTMTNCSIAAQKQARQCLETGGSLTKLANGLKTTTVASKAASAGMKALSIAGNLIAGFAVAKGIEWVATSISNYVNASYIAKEKTEALSSSLSEAQSKYAEDSKKIGELSSRYETLSKGVNHLGQNVSLSSSQYDEYKSVIQQLSDIMPDLTLRPDEIHC